MARKGERDSATEAAHYRTLQDVRGMAVIGASPENWRITRHSHVGRCVSKA